MAKTEKTGELKVTFLPNELYPDLELERTAAGNYRRNMAVGENGQVSFDPYAEAESEQLLEINEQLQTLRRNWEKGELSPRELAKKTRQLYRVSHSIGRGGLRDNRVLPPNRVQRFVDWAVSRGLDAEKAERKAWDIILEQGTKQGGSLAGRGWGSVEVTPGLLDELSK